MMMKWLPILYTAFLLTAGCTTERTLAPEDQALSLGRGLTDAKPSGMLLYRDYLSKGPTYFAWTLLDGTNAAFYPREHFATNSITRITSLGMQAVPLLLALLDDESPTSIAAPSYACKWLKADAWGRATNYGDFNDNAPVRLTRSNVACLLLHHVIPPTTNKMQQTETSVRSFQAYCEQWYKTHKDDTQLDLIKHYYNSGDWKQRGNATWLLMHRTHHDAQTFMDELLTEGSIYLAMQAVYLVQLRPEMKDSAIGCMQKAIKRLESGQNDRLLLEAGGCTSASDHLRQYIDALQDGIDYLKEEGKWSTPKPLGGTKENI